MLALIDAAHCFRALPNSSSRPNQSGSDATIASQAVLSLGSSDRIVAGRYR